MNVSELMEFVRDRQGGRSIERYANLLGFRGSTLSRYYTGQRRIGIDVLHKLAKNAKERQDTILLGALISYALDLGISDKDELARIGSCLLEIHPTPS